MSKLLLGPIVGHTDHTSTTIWIRVRDDPSDYNLRVSEGGIFPFVGTETTPEFGTAMAKAEGLRSDWEYRYKIIRRKRVVEGSRGTFHTMPVPGSMADVLFISISCSHGTEKGAWPLLDQYIKSAKPRFIIMMGDQVYIDTNDEIAAAVWPNHLNSSSSLRREAIVAKYQEHWSSEPIRSIMANTPTYMMWDDHEIRNGWGSYAPDSPTLAARYPRGAEISASYNAYFEDTRDVYWHFQACHNPPPPSSLGLPSPGSRIGMPFFFRCGRLLVLVIDSRSARDLWRENNPILGDEQWKFITDLFNGLSSDIDALALVTPLPLTSMSHDGIVQNLLGHRTDDVELFKKGQGQALLELLDTSGGPWEAIKTLLGSTVGANIGDFHLKDLTDIRDNWANHFSRQEQVTLIKATAQAQLTNRLPSQPRILVLIGGDLHAGGMFELSISDSSLTSTSMVTSGIGKQTSLDEGIVGILMDRDFEISDGIHAHLQKFTRVYNFGVTHVLFGGGMSNIINAIAHEGNNVYLTI